MRGEGANSNDFEDACPVELKFLFEDFVIGASAQSLSGCGGCVVYPYPATVYVFGAAEKRVRECRVASVYASNCKGVLFTHELVGALLPFSGEIAIGEWSRSRLWWAPPWERSKTARGRRGKHPICTSLGEKPVAALTELL